MNKWLLLTLGLFTTILYSQDYNCNLIPDSLTKEADIIIRHYKEEFKVLNEGEALRSYQNVFTVMNQAGQDRAYQLIYYDDFINIKKLSSSMLDASGKLINKYSRKDFGDGSVGGAFINDGRYKVLEYHRRVFPYTVILDVQERYSGLVSYPFWEPIPYYRYGVQHSEFKIVYPEDMKIQVKQLNTQIEPRCDLVKGQRSMTWEIFNVAPIIRESYSDIFRYSAPSVWLAPTDFEYDGTHGNMESWQNFGLWSWQLLEGRDELPAETIAEIHALIDGMTDTRYKVERLYKYMQSKTRYVNVSLGIGGWQPHPAAKVNETGYGDCKALSNYMRAILKVANIGSNYTIIGNGQQKILFEDFACMGQSNHVIVAVPLEKDTIWLECTSQSMPFGYIGESNSHRKAVMITQQGGMVVNTPTYASATNKQLRNAKVKLDADGEATASIHTVFTGGQFESRAYVINQNKDDQKKWLLKRMDFASPVISSFNYSEPLVVDGLPFLEEKMEVTLNKFSSKTGKRIIFPLMLMDNFEAMPPNLKKREREIVKEDGYIDFDTISYTLPSGYSVELFPEDRQVSSIFGDYQISLDVKADTVLLIRKLHMFSGVWPADKYLDFQDFYRNIRNADNRTVILIQNES